MKRLIIMTLVCFVAYTAANAQPGKKPPTPKEVQQKMEQDMKKAQKDMEQAAKNNKPPDPPGKAYGKDKGGLEGRDFGQNRAAEARSKKDMQEAVAKNIQDAEDLHKATLAKVADGLAKLESKHKAKQIAEADYQAKKKALEDIQAKVKALEKRNDELKSRTSK